jgi:Zn-dependent protease
MCNVAYLRGGVGRRLVPWAIVVIGRHVIFVVVIVVITHALGLTTQLLLHFPVVRLARAAVLLDALRLLLHEERGKVRAGTGGGGVA